MSAPVTSHHLSAESAKSVMALLMGCRRVGTAGGMALAFITGCGTSNNTCNLGDTRACTTSSCSGEQICEGDPPTWSSCECDGAMDASMADNDSDAGPLQSRVGEACDDDDDCTGDETCLGPDDTSYLGGGPPSGVCVLECTGNPSLCQNLSQPALCVLTDDGGTDRASDDTAYCFEACEFGGDPGGKCQDRSDLACSAVASDGMGSAHLSGMRDAAGDAGTSTSVATAFCRPLCVRDADCENRVCDRVTGACVESSELTPPDIPGGGTPDAGSGGTSTISERGDPLGSPCDPADGLDSSDSSGAISVARDPSACEGSCVTVDGLSFCSHRCRLGVAGECGDLTADADDEEAGQTGMCRFTEGGGGIGDTAFCAELCDCNGDCQHPDAVCEPFSDEDVARLVGRGGVCVSGVGEANAMREGMACP